MANAAEFIFESEQWQKIIKKIQKKWKDIESRKELGGILSSVVYADIMDHFDKEEGPDGPWKDWSDGYKKHLKKIGRSGNKKLQFSGNLRQGVKPNNWRPKSEGVLFYNNAKTKGVVTDDNQSNRDLQKLKRSETQKSLKKRAKKLFGNKIAGKVSKALAKRIVKVEKRKKTISGKGFPYAEAHDKGGPKLPQRKFMWLSKEGMEKIIKQVTDWLEE
jgi:phage gpG-like protein